MQKSTDSQQKKRKDAIFSAVFYSLLTAVTAIVTLYIRFRFDITGFLGALLLIIALVDLGIIIPIYIILKERLKEIQGGEEDAAAQY